MPICPQPSPDGRCYNALRWIGLVIGCTAKFVTGSLFVYNVYEDAIKDTFNHTEKELGFHSSVLNVGLGVGFLPGMFYDRFGPQLTSCMGLVISVGAYMLLWSTTKNVEFYRQRSGLMSFYFFLVGVGSVFTYMVALNTNAINFHEKHRGKVVSLLNAFFAGSPSVFSVIYYHVIGKSDPNSSESFANFMLLFAILFGAVDLICIFFLRIYPQDLHVSDQEIIIPESSTKNNQEMKSYNSLEADDNSCCNTDDAANDDQNSETILRLFRNVDYHLLTWAFTFAATVGLIYNITLTQIADSVHLKDKEQNLVLIIPITNAIVSAAIGLISDQFKDRFPRLMILIGGFIAFTIAQVLVITLVYRYTIFIIATTFCGIGIGILWSLTPTIISEYFSIKNFGRNWGIALFTAGMVGLAGQSAFGAMYDDAIKDPGSLYCYGMDCIRGGHSLSLAFAVMSLILGSVLYIKKRVTQRRSVDGEIL